MIYVASSWRNPWQPGVVTLLRALGHEVYDFREPAPGQKGFGWSEIDPEWKSWDAHAFRKGLRRSDGQPKTMGDYCALIHSEVTEAFEEYREGRSPGASYYVAKDGRAFDIPRLPRRASTRTWTPSRARTLACSSSRAARARTWSSGTPSARGR